ncbi:hypothetical protein [Kordia sp.]|uniref:hypothetical protein n=1 Tax=Kordia sp. TaxID=1965332 RepID=UPI003D2A51EB
MNLISIKEKLQTKSILHDDSVIIEDMPSVIGYDKQFRWSWMATQLNTFFVASDCGNTPITKKFIEEHLKSSFTYTKYAYNGWPRGLQSGVGVISILISDTITEEAKTYCKKLQSGKKWAAFTIPVVIDSNTKEVFFFDKKPMWGRIYFPYFEKIIKELTSK